MGCLIKKLSQLTPVVNELVRRSNALGSDPKVTNYAGGNTSAKGIVTDPISGKKISLTFVKGSGGDLGTLKEEGLAVLYTERIHELKKVYPGVDREDEMVALFDYCLFGKGGAAPSIDTSMHGLVDQLHVDHLHPDSIIAIATSVDGRSLTKRCFGDEILWVDWRRPGFQLGLEIAQIAADNPNAKGCILGGHGLTTWADSSDECEKRSLEAINKAADFIQENGKIHPFGKHVDKFQALDEGAPWDCIERYSHDRTFHGLGNSFGFYRKRIPRKVGCAGNILPGSLPANKSITHGFGLRSNRCAR
jgi:rhamnose utilization protein RhaD (predicted bifunctional aldolase and dehydrogenase)